MTPAFHRPQPCPTKDRPKPHPAGFVRSVCEPLLACAGGRDYAVPFNARHLRAAREFGIEVLKPADLLKLISEIK